MGLRSYLRGDDLLEHKTETRSLPVPENQLPLSGLPAIWSGPTYWKLRPVEALAIADVWAAVRVLADAVSSLPLHVYRKADTGRERVTSGKLVDLLERPSPGVSEADLTSTLMCHVLVWGSAYLAKYRQADEVAELGLLHPDRVRPELQDGRLRFRYDPPKGPQLLLTEADVVMVRGLSVDSLTGLSAVSQAARVLGLSDSLVKHAMSFFESDTPRPAGVLRLGDQEFQPSEEGRQRSLETIKNELKPHGILVITGDAEYENVGEKLDDGQFVEQRRLAAQEIARVFRIPPHMIGAPTGESMTYDTVEQQSLDFARYSILPWTRRIELSLSGDRDLAFQRQFVKFEIDALLRPDSAGRAAFYTAALDPITGWMSREEVRRLEDLEPESTPPPRQTVEQMLARPQEVGVNGSQ